MNTPRGVVFEETNRTAILGWVVAPVIPIFAFAVSLQGGPDAADPSFGWGVVVLWGLVLFIEIVLLRLPITTVRASRGKLRVIDRHLWGERTKEWALSDVAAPKLSSVASTEGSPGYQCTLKLPDGRQVLLAFGDGPRVKDAYEQLIAVMAANQAERRTP
ncbi:hypothetical protein LJR016_005335 [Devosia sp. LjRoot16]|uniref:hypothetical protein n=1 Tax=Devosia sp. LjRoot16 TaxID=3342271 RepID=UPI003ECE73BB